MEVLHKYGIETWLLDLASYIFPLAAYKEVAKEIEKRVEAQGVHLMFGVTIDHMEQENGEKTAVLTDGSRIPADIVGLCIGTRAITETVQGEVEIGRGIVVPEFMLQVTAVKATTWKAARTRSLVCGPMPITRVKLPVSTWRGEIWSIREVSFTISPIL